MRLYSEGASGLSLGTDPIAAASGTQPRHDSGTERDSRFFPTGALGLMSEAQTDKPGHRRQADDSRTGVSRFQADDNIRGHRSNRDRASRVRAPVGTPSRRVESTGWIQQVRIRVLDSIPQTAEPEGPVGLSDGAIDTSDGRLNNGVELPFEASGPCTISMQTTQGDIITVTGREVFVIAEGEPTFVEALPEDMRSKEAVEADPRGKSSSWRCARAGRSTARR